MKLITLFALAAISCLELAQAGSTPFCTSKYYSPSVCKKFAFPRGVDCNPHRTGPEDIDEQNIAKFSSKRAWEFAAGISNIFENGQPQLNYATCESIDDGRGYTCGNGGYTSNDGSMRDPLLRYERLLKEKNRKNPFEKYMAKLTDIFVNSNCTAYRGTLKGLEGIGKLWTQSACTDKIFRQAQDETLAAGIDHWSMSHAAFYNVSTNLGLAIFRDTQEMHGDDTGEPLIGMEKLGRLTKQALAGKDAGEKVFISKFLEIRREMLCCYRPEIDGERDITWPEAADRIADLQHLVKTGNWDLKPPIILKNYGATLKANFNLYASPKECKHIKSRCLDASDTNVTTVHDKGKGHHNAEVPFTSANASSTPANASDSAVPNHAGRNRADNAGLLLFSFLGAVAWLFV